MLRGFRFRRCLAGAARRLCRTCWSRFGAATLLRRFLGGGLAPGFAAELLPRVFQRFVKGEASEGHGLGLAFVSAVALVHGGRALARNRDGGGAQIVVELPLAQPRGTPESSISGVLTPQ